MDTHTYLYNSCGFYECYPIVVVLLYPRGDGENVGIEDDVIGVVLELAQ